MVVYSQAIHTWQYLDGCHACYSWHVPYTVKWYLLKGNNSPASHTWSVSPQHEYHLIVFTIPYIAKQANFKIIITIISRDRLFVHAIYIPPSNLDQWDNKSHNE